MKNINRRTFITTAAMAGAGALTTLVNSCNSDDPDPIDPPVPPKPTELAPTSDRQPLTYAEWESKGFPTIVRGANGAKFLISNAESQKFITKGVNADNIIIGPAQTAEVTIEGPGDFAAKAEQIKKHFADGVATVNVTLKQNIPATADVLGILNQKTITGTNVKWAEGSAAFVPATANQEIDGTLFANLPVGNDGDKRFYVPENKNSRALKDFRGLVNTDHIATSWLLGMITGLRAQERYTVDTGKTGTLQDAIDANNFTGYTGKESPIYVRLQDETKQLVLENANVDILSKFLTSEVRALYNYGYTSNRKDLISNGKPLNSEFGSGKVIHLTGAYNEVLANSYANLAIKSMKIGKNDILYESGYFVNGKDISNSARDMIDFSCLNYGQIDFTTESEEIDIRNTQLPGCQSDWGKGKVLRTYQGYLEWQSKDVYELKKYNRKLKIGKDVLPVIPWGSSWGEFRFNNGQRSWNVHQDVVNIMLNDHNIVIDPKPEMELLDDLWLMINGGFAAPRMKVVAGWGQEWWKMPEMR